MKQMKPHIILSLMAGLGFNYKNPPQGRDARKWHDTARMNAAEEKRLRKQAKRLRNEK